MRNLLGQCGLFLVDVVRHTYPSLGIGFIGVAFAFGLTVLTGVYTFGHISGGHFNPAVSFGLWVGGRFSGKDLVPYIIAQILGGILGATILYVIATGKPGFELGNFATNGYGANSPGGYSLLACFVCEITMTFMFVMIILGATHKKAPKGFAGIAIGLGLTLIHLVSIPVTNTSVNPARSIAPALFVGASATSQLWFFCIAPIIGATIAGLVYKCLAPNEE